MSNDVVENVDNFMVDMAPPSPSQLKSGHLAFYARGEHIVPPPGFVRSLGGGTPARYVGRERKDMGKGRWAFPATQEPYFVLESSQVAQQLAFQCRHNLSLWAADQHTARVCGVAFVKTVFKDGEHVEA